MVHNVVLHFIRRFPPLSLFLDQFWRFLRFKCFERDYYKIVVLQDDFTVDFDDQNDVQIQFIDGEDFPLANFTEHRASDHEFYSDESELSSEDSSEDEEENDERYGTCFSLPN